MCQAVSSKTALERWSGIIKKNNFDSFAQLRETFPTADLVGKLTVFNIGGNKYRLIAAIHFNRQKVYIRDVLTHKVISGKERTKKLKLKMSFI